MSAQVNHSPPPIDRYNLVANLVSLLKTLCSQTHYEVIKRRFGLEGSPTYTLQEVGDYYQLSRQRIQQMEAKVKSDLHGTLFESTPLPLGMSQDIKSEARTLRTEMTGIGPILSEYQAIEALMARYGVPVEDYERGSLHLLLDSFEFSPTDSLLSKGGVAVHPAWVTSKHFDKKAFVQSLRVVHEVLRDNVVPVSEFDLRRQVIRKTQQRVDNEIMGAVSAVSKEIEEVETTQGKAFQLKFEYLTSLADKTVRILFEAEKPLLFREITKEINHRMVGISTRRAPLRSVQAQLLDERFIPIGRSGLWGLSSWKGVPNRTIVDLMKDCFHRTKSAARPEQVYEYVRSQRPDASRRSVESYLTSKTDTFVRVGKSTYELKVWGAKPIRQPRRKASSRAPIRDNVQELITRYLLEQPDNKALVSSTARYVMGQTKCPKQTFYAYLSKMQNVRKDGTAEGLYCQLIN